MDILLVDDSKTMRMIVQRAIRQAGFRGLTIEEAESGVEALEKLAGKRPKIVLSDWNMPEMLGIDLLERLRGEQNTVPFGFVTSEASAEIRQRALDAGALFVITKPFGPEDFQDALGAVLEG
jgi:two-component system chemotaxis response regulator CheY